MTGYDIAVEDLAIAEAKGDQKKVNDINEYIAAKYPDSELEVKILSESNADVFVKERSKEEHEEFVQKTFDTIRELGKDNFEDEYVYFESHADYEEPEYDEFDEDEEDDDNWDDYWGDTPGVFIAYRETWECGIRDLVDGHYDLNREAKEKLKLIANSIEDGNGINRSRKYEDEEDFKSDSEQEEFDTFILNYAMDDSEGVGDEKGGYDLESLYSNFNTPGLDNRLFAGFDAQSGDYFNYDYPKFRTQ